MFDVIPEVMSRSHRGICPTCGAAMPLAESGRDARCEFCGGGSTLQHRLRAIEASAGELQAPKIKGATRWLRKQARYEKCNCPGCGAEFDADTEQSIQTCKYCGTQSKLETRLVAITAEDVEPPQRRTRADVDNQNSKRLDYPWEITTEQLCWRIIHEPELMPRVNLAKRFQKWGYINHTAVHFLPWVLKHVQTDNDMVVLYACDAVGKLLCQGDPTLWPGTIQACRGVIFDVKAKRTILSELGLGKGVCVKTLIDAAEYAAVHGDRDYCCHALWAVNTLIGRNFPEHPGPYLFRHNERLRLWLVNHTMMDHPIHLHGMWMQIENGQPHENLPYKHTVLVKPGEKISMLITPIEKGDWAFHCHLLYHMHSGMFQIVTVAPRGNQTDVKRVGED
jgi:DNA-directed RNA polymerase subunit RPC12/RpoP